MMMPARLLFCICVVAAVDDLDYRNPLEDYEYSPLPGETDTEMIHLMSASCSPGSYSPPGFGTCLLCETGTYASGTMATACVQCEAGRFSGADGASQCAQCAAGKFSFFSGSSVCSSCPAWTGSVAGTALCVTCSNSSSAVCMYADGSACPSCSGACRLCRAGYFNDGESSLCTGCGAGTYLATQGATSSAACTACLSGTYTRPRNTGLSACLQCSQSAAMSLPLNAVYQIPGDPMLCNWKCDSGFQNMAASPPRESAEWDAMSGVYLGQGYSEALVVQMIRYRSDYCCDSSSVNEGQYRFGCTKDSTGTVEWCALVANAKHVKVETPANPLDRCLDWVCDAGYFKFNGRCNPQPVCGAGLTYARESVSGELIVQPSGAWSCVSCPVCADGTETAAPCNGTHSAVCRLCGGGRMFSVGGGPCVKEAPLGFRGVRTMLSISPPWGARPTLAYDNRAFVWVPSTVFYSYVACVAAGVGRRFTGGDAVCNPESGACGQCATQCSPWQQQSSWFRGVGWYGAVSCSSCQFDPALCLGDQFLNMSACGPVNPAKCVACPSTMPVANQVGWVNPRDVAFTGQYPCRVVCAAGYSEVNGQCVMCGDLPANVILVNGCEWRCKPGYLQNGNRCDQCPASPECAVGLYPDYLGSSNVCLSCQACQKPPNAVFVTAGTFGVSASCAYACQGGFFRLGDQCVACNQQRVCVSGSEFLVPCTEVADSRCLACRRCAVGERELQACGAVGDAVCGPCDAGLKPGNASWTAPGCDSWACVAGFWKDGAACRQCSGQSDCGVGTRLQIMASMCPGSTGKCVACPKPFSGECFNGDSDCGTTRVCGISTPMLVSTPRVTTVAATTSRTSAVLSLSTILRSSTPLPGTNPVTTPSAPPEAFASLASLAIRPNVTVGATLFAALAKDISVLVCAEVKGFCNVSVLAVTVNNVTTYCDRGVCLGYARRRRMLLAVGTTTIIMGIMTQTQITDVSMDTVPGVESSIIMPNSPIRNLTSSALDSRSLVQYVQQTFTVFNVAPPVVVVTDNSGVTIAVAVGLTAVVVAIAVGVYVVWRGQRNQSLVGDTYARNEARFTAATALQSIRITKENLKSL
jgi:hypothetical protein